MNGVEVMAYFERDSEPRSAGWRDPIMSLAVVGALAAGLLLSACGTNLPQMAEMIKEAALGRPASSDENLVNKGYREMEAGNYSYAEIYLDSALSINPSNPLALLNMAVVYEKTGRENEARALYSALVRHNPSDASGTVLTVKDSDRSIAEVALEPMRQNLESDWRARMDERISLLQDLYAEGFISEDELLARLGGAWSRSHGDASLDVSEVSYRIEALDSLLQRGMISSQSYAVERGLVLDELAPIMAMPVGQSPQAIATAEPPAESSATHPAQSAAETPTGTSANAQHRRQARTAIRQHRRRSRRSPPQRTGRMSTSLLTVRKKPLCSAGRP
jgi:tetratricopeptide (TPR) repeat protein